MNPYRRHRFHTLDGMRGIAAILVMLHHYYAVDHSRFLQNCFVAVDFFFILSGFVLCHAYGPKIRAGLATVDYMARRIGRLYPVVAISLLVGAPALYLRTVAVGGGYTGWDFAATLVTNFAMLPYLTIRTVPIEITLFPAAPPLWSIFFEVFASFSLPFLVRLPAWQLLRICAACLVILCIDLVFRGAVGQGRSFDSNVGFRVDNFLDGFPRVLFGFCCGMIIFRLRERRTPGGSRLPAASPWAVYAALVAVLTFPFAALGLYSFFAATMLAPILVLLGSYATGGGRMSVQISRFLGWISYPLYCLHVPIRNSVDFLYARLHIWQRIHLSSELCAVAATLLLSMLVGHLADRFHLQGRVAAFLRRILSYVAS